MWPPLLVFQVKKVERDFNKIPIQHYVQEQTNKTPE